MRWITYTTPARSASDAGAAGRAGLLVDGSVHGLAEPLLTLIASDGGLPAAADRARSAPVEVLRPDDVQVLAPIPDPPSVRDFLSFEEHTHNALRALGREVSPVWYRQPVFYFTNPVAVVGPDADVPIPPGSAAFDYEVEVAAVIGRAGSDLTPEQAEASIAGYTIFCDWSARDLQGVESQVGLGPAKGKDGITSLGPVLVTPDELEPYRSGHGYALRMSAAVNGRTYGGGSWAAINWSFGQMIAYASRGTRLRPGDVIGSGTVGTGCILELSGLHGRDAYPWLAPGDRVEVAVEQLGSLVGRIVEGAPVVPLGAPAVNPPGA
jgi:2-keto-4-pentenoate hydratase/2-oxohepta-3-ene-1,7-dioic acid hydratase in catechol pathway